MALDLNVVMTGIGDRLRTITGLRVSDFPTDGANPPHAIVSLPEMVEYDTVAGRGADRVIIPITVLVGKVSDRTARTNLAGYVSGTGATSIKSAVDGDLGGTAHTARVTEATINVVTIQAVEYLGATLNVEVYD